MEGWWGVLQRSHPLVCSWSFPLKVLGAFLMHWTATCWDVGKICWVGVSTICRCTLNDTENKTSKQTKNPHHIQVKKHPTSYRCLSRALYLQGQLYACWQKDICKLEFQYHKAGQRRVGWELEAIHGQLVQEPSREYWNLVLWKNLIEMTFLISWPFIH